MNQNGKSREPDWREFIGRLVYCWGCGRFGLPQAGKRLPRGWAMLYQPHREGPSLLLACGSECKAKIQRAIRGGPVLHPLAQATEIPMPADLREAMMADAERERGNP